MTKFKVGDVVLIKKNAELIGISYKYHGQKAKIAYIVDPPTEKYQYVIEGMKGPDFLNGGFALHAGDDYLKLCNDIYDVYALGEAVVNGERVTVKFKLCEATKDMADKFKQIQGLIPDIIVERNNDDD